MRSGHAAMPAAPVMAAGVGVRDAHRYAIRLASFRLESPAVGHAALGIVTPRQAAGPLAGLLTGRIAPAYGQLQVLGHDLRTASGRAAVQSSVGTASRTARVWPTITIRGLVERAARRSGQPRYDRRLLVAAILDRLALVPWAQVPLRAAPGLVARRARLAAACVHEPDLLVIDGLFDHLNLRDRLALADVVRDLKRDMSLVALGADADALLLFCDQVVTFADGLVVGAQRLPSGPGSAPDGRASGDQLTSGHGAPGHLALCA